MRQGSEAVWIEQARRSIKGIALAGLLLQAPVRKAQAQHRIDIKTMLYDEGSDRMRILSPAFSAELEYLSGWSIKVDGIYNSISGASPTGIPGLKERTIEDVTVTTTDPVVITVPTPYPAPPSAPSTGDPVSVTPAPDDDHDDDEWEDDEWEDDRRWTGRLPATARWHSRAAATPVAPAPVTPAPAPAPSAPASPSGGGSTETVVAGQTVTNVTTRTVSEVDPQAPVPKAPVDDERYGFTFELGRRLGHHRLAMQLAFSSESDYVSRGVALRDAIEMNERNTILTLGAAYTADTVDAVTMDGPEDKTTVDLMLGITQLLNRYTRLTANLSYGTTEGYLTDPYKAVWLNGTVQRERRPDSKDRQILLLALNRHLATLNGSLETSYRFYHDDFGITAHTLQLAWFQWIGRRLILRPAVRYYRQDAADFYAVTFTGNPDYYSSDYRLSELDSVGYGLKVIVLPSPRWSIDLAVERFDMSGQDGITPADAYPRATVVMGGLRVWL